MLNHLIWLILAFISRTLLGGGAAVILTSVALLVWGPDFSWMLPLMGVGIIGAGLGIGRLRDLVDLRITEERRSRMPRSGSDAG